MRKWRGMPICELCKYWIPGLRKLAKKVIYRCNGCKRFRAIACLKPKTGNLPADRTQGNRAFHVIGVDFAGPFLYQMSQKTVGKANILLYICSLSRAVYLDVLPNQSF